MTVGAAIPTIAPRSEFLKRAVESVIVQTHPVDQISVTYDTERLGASANRNAAWQALTTEWVAFLDDDDYWYPNHIEVLTTAQQESDADVVYGWFDCLSDPFPQFEGVPWSNDAAHLFPICYLVRTELLKDVGGFPPPPMPSPYCAGEDWELILKYVEAGATIHHVPERTWKYEHHGGNTSGLAYLPNGIPRW